MADKSELIDEIGALSKYAVRSGEDVIELRDAYQGLADKLGDVMDSVNESISEFDRVSELIDSGELSLDEDSERMLTWLTDMNEDMISNMGGMRSLYTDIEIAANTASNVASTFQDIVELTRQIR